MNGKNIVAVLKSEDRIRELASLPQVGPGKSIIEVVTAERDKIRGYCESTPEAADLHVKMAQVQKLNEVLDLPYKAQQIINKQEKKS